MADAVDSSAVQPQQPGERMRFRVVCHSCGCDVILVKRKRRWMHWLVTPVGGIALLAACILLSNVCQDEFKALSVLRQADVELKALGVSDAQRYRLVRGWELVTTEADTLTPLQLDAVRTMYAHLHPMHARNCRSREASRSFAATKHLIATSDSQIPMPSVRTYIEDGAFPAATTDQPLVRAISFDARTFESALMSPDESSLALFILSTPAFVGIALLSIGLCATFVASRFGFSRRLTCPSCSGSIGLTEPHVGEQQLRVRRAAIVDEHAAQAARDNRALALKVLRKSALRDMKTAERVIRHKCRSHCIPSPYLERPERSLGKFVAAVTGGWQARFDARMNTVMRFFKCAGQLEDREFQRALGAYLICFYMESEKRWSIWESSHKSDRDCRAGWRYIDAQDAGIAMLFIGSERDPEEFETYLHTLARALRDAESEWDPATARSRIPNGLQILRATIGPEIDGY